MLIKNLSKRERIIALATFAIAAAAVLYAFVIEPVAQQWKNLNNEIESKLNMLKKDSRLLSMDKAIEADYAKFAQYIKSTKKEEEELAGVLAEIENAARNSSCFIVTIKPQGTKNMGSYKEMLIDLTAEADMGQFSRFLYDIERSSSLILRVKRFTISSRSTQPNTLRGSFLIGKILIE